MKARKVLLLLGLMCALALLCTACSSTTALDNIDTYYSEVGAVLDDWFSSSSGADTSGTGGDRVVKSNDHAMDDIRYFAATVAAKNGGSFFAGSVERASI